MLFFSGIAISDELDKVRFSVCLMNRQLIVIILGNENNLCLSRYTLFSSFGFKGSLGMESYMGKYCIC